MNSPLVYRDRPVFGLDIGFSSLKVMQIETQRDKQWVRGYGVASYDPAAITDGVITDPEAIAKVAHEMFEKNIVGQINTRRVAVSIPASRSFARAVTLPKMKRKDIQEALRQEAEQYIPMPVDDLYMDYNIVSQNENEIELLSIAVPRKIVDSYMQLLYLLGLEPVALEPTIGAAGRLFVYAEKSDLPTVLIDFGSISSDVTIYDGGLVVTGTVSGGGDSFTNIIAETLNVSRQEAHIIKTKYGLGMSKKQAEISQSMTPLLNQHVKEIRRMIRYYEERSGTEKKISQIVTMGGGANMPGLSEFLTSVLRLPVRMCDPWQHLGFRNLQPPNSVEKSMYVTAAGLALVSPKEIFA